MPIEYKIVNDKKLVLAKGIGVITSNDVISHLESLTVNTEYQAAMKKLVDYRSIDSINITQAEAEIIARKKEAFSKKFPGEKCAFVAPDDLTYGTSRVHQSLTYFCDDINTQVFRILTEALDWLGVELPPDLED